MAVRVPVNPEFFPWAVHRARGDMEDFALRFPKLTAWMAEGEQPTLKQLEKFAAATHAPIGFFFLPKPPHEALPIADFRTVGSAEVESPSADLLDTIYVCQQRQEWYREFSRSVGALRAAFVGSLTTATDTTEAAALITRELGFSLEVRKACKSWNEALRHLVTRCEASGILVMVSGIVGSNTKRVLDPEEFRGFCLVDDVAPVVFINGTDSKSAQMFTLMHEVAHLWIGQAGVSNLSLTGNSTRPVETWCNAVAAEVLVPLEELKREVDRTVALEAELKRLGRVFKVSSLVLLRRLLDANVLLRPAFDRAYGLELKRLSRIKAESSSGGDFYHTETVRVGRRFASALLVSTYEGNTLFRDASRLLGIKKAATLDEFASRLGVH
jgi:Zn-dependent peptidase ImmA (M78 family)